MFYDVLEFVASRFNVPLYDALRTEERRAFFGDEVRRSLIIGVSDGAHTDLLRRFNVDRLSNDQVLLSIDADIERLGELRGKLAEAVKDPAAKFTRVYLIDDFTASGTTFFRSTSGKYNGKFQRFKDRFTEQLSEAKPAIEGNALIRVHHFLGTALAEQNLLRMMEEAQAQLGASGRWFAGGVKLTFGHILSRKIPLRRDDGSAVDSRDEAFLELCRKYYDPTIEKAEHDQVELQ